MKYHRIELTNPEIYVAGVVGTMRRVASRQNGNNKNKHARKSDWNTEIDGVMAEMALAQYLDVYWEPKVNAFKQPDVAGFQVRSTRHSNGHLLIRHNDTVDNQTYVLVITAPPICTLVGSLLCGAAKQDRFYRTAINDDEAPCWWVPQDILDDLPAAGMMAAPLVPAKGDESTRV